MSLLVNAVKKHDEGDLEKAAELYHEHIVADSQNPEALNLYGLCLTKMGKYNLAEEVFSRALAKKADNPELYRNRGAIRASLGKISEALLDYEKSLQLLPQDFGSLLNAGSACIKLNKSEKAVFFFQKATEISPKDDGAIAGLACSLSMRALQAIQYKKFKSAIKDLIHANKLCPEEWEILFNLGNAYLKSGDYKKASQAFGSATKLNCKSVDLFANLGVAQERLGLYSKSEESYTNALNLNPKNSAVLYNKSLLLLKTGRYEQGFKLYEHRWLTNEFRQFQREFNVPLWLGQQNLDAKTILCHAEQGLGDTIQFLRFCKMFDTKKTTVFVQCDSDLIEIAQTMQLRAEFYETGSKLPDYDFHCPLMSLPAAFSYRPELQKAQEPYLFPSRIKIEKFDKKLGPRIKPRVGLVLEGKPSHVHNHLRSVIAVDFIKFLPKGADYFLLQKELSSQTKALTSKRPDVTDLSGSLIDFSDTAAACSNMDLIITVDTAVAHLAGAIGCPTSLLLHYQSDWRWGLETKSSHWYSNMSLIRLQRDCNWPDVYAEITANIQLIL